jgi:NADPH:quinone reductase-like Zn-dependent oxidoreductase
MKTFMPVELPTILGYDYSGVVRSVGKGVEGYAEGDKVFGRAGKCYAELLLADLAGLSKLPKGLDPIEAAALPVVLNTGEQLIVRAGKVQPGQTIVITGALGSVGRTAVWVAKKVGAHVIAGVRGSQKKAAEELGADALLALDNRQENSGCADANKDLAVARLGILPVLIPQLIGPAVLVEHNCFHDRTSQVLPVRCG